MELLFKLTNVLVFPFWALMLFAPRWRWTQRVMSSPWVVVGPATLYVVLLLPHLVEHAPTLMRPELDKIASLLGSHIGATLSWTHFLAFDLFVGRWIYLDARRRGITAWLISPVLFLTLLFGPFGFMVYLCAATLFGRAKEAEATALTDSTSTL